MKEKYHGIVSGNYMGIVYGNCYEDKRKAEKEVRRKAKELARNSFDENYPGYEKHDYRSMVIGGVRIC
ncbi:hypothetical protein FACS1894137_03690 [Spirochaetia bacterium]|nr:hypothetical protein FACS1894137_03690 [Spirochaetia bacterium]